MKPLTSAFVLVGLGALCFSLMGLSAKCAQTYTKTTAFGMLAVRCGLSLPVNLIATFQGHPRKVCAGTAFPEGTYKWLAVRALGGFACVILEYVALKQLPLKTNAMILYSSPAFIVIWSAILFRESIRPVVVFCISLSFVGLSLEVRPWNHSMAAPMWAYCAALLASVLAGLVYVSLRMLKGVEYYTVMNAFLITCLLLSLIVGSAVHELKLDNLNTWSTWPYLLGVAGFSYVAEVAMTCGYAMAGSDSGQVSVVKFLSPIFSLVWGVVFLHEGFVWLDIAGSVLVIGSSVAIVYVPVTKGHVADNTGEDTSCTASCTIESTDQDFDADNIGIELVLPF